MEQDVLKTNENSDVSKMTSTEQNRQNKEASANTDKSGEVFILQSFDFSSHEGNEFINLSMRLMSLSVRLKTLDRLDNANFIHEQVVNEVLSIGSDLYNLGIDQSIILTHRYCLCTFLDEMVLKSNWAADTIWISNPLSARFFNESWGGEKIFDILANLLLNPDRDLNFKLIEFIYHCLLLGYDGKYALKSEAYKDREDGVNKISHLIDSLSVLLEKRIKEVPDDLFKIAYSCKKEKTSNKFSLSRFFFFISWSVPLVVCGLLFFRYHYDLDKQIAQVSQQITKEIDKLSTT